MERNERIYVPPKRGPLPRKYRLGLDRPNYNWWHLGIAVAALAAVTAGVWVVLP